MGKFLIVLLLMCVAVLITVVSNVVSDRAITEQKHRDIMNRLETVIKLNEMSRDGELEEWVFDYVAKDDPFLQSLKSKYFDKEIGIEP